MGSFSAITPGSDLSRQARELVRLHDAVISGGHASTQPRAVVQRSWSRMLRLGLDPSGHNTRAVLPRAELERRRQYSPLGLVIDDLRHVLTGVADASHFLMVITDAEGVILWREGSARVLLRADSLGFTEGAVWTEQQVGTNMHVGGTTTVVPGFPQTPVDTNGAGDTHTGALLAEVAAGTSWVEGCRRANAAAAIKVTRRGPASAPTAAEVDAFLAGLG